MRIIMHLEHILLKFLTTYQLLLTFLRLQNAFLIQGVIKCLNRPVTDQNLVTLPSFASEFGLRLSKRSISPEPAASLEKPCPRRRRFSSSQARND
jgi:hypothetical protein